MNPNRTNNLWCKRCLWHKCRCGVNRVSMPSLMQYTRTMTMDDLRRNALESVIEELKERDA